MTNRDKTIFEMFDGGLAPSEIDRRLGLLDGTAHTVIIAAWSRDKELAKLERIKFGWLK